MLRTITTVVTGALCVTFFAGAATAQEPKKANKYQATVVNAYDECTAPSESTAGALPLPACPAVDDDAGACNFTEKGGGKILAKTKDDVALQFKIKGIDPACEGQILLGNASVQISSDNCTTSSRCTTQTVNFPIPQPCTVTKGKCQIKTTINTLVPGAVTPGDAVSITIGRVTVGIAAGTTASFAAGVLVP